MNRTKIFLWLSFVFVTILVMVTLGLIVGRLLKSEKPKVTPIESSQEQKTSIKFQQLQKIDLGEGIFANIIFANDHFYVSYELREQGIFLNVYDQDFNFQEKHQLSDKEGADHQLVLNDDYFYLATSFNLKKNDSNFQEIKSVGYFDQLPTEIKEKWPNGVNDMLLTTGENSLYLGMASGNVSKEDKAQKKDIADDLYLQKYNLDLELEKDFLLKGLGNTPGSSLIENNEGFTIITSDKHWDDSSLLAVRYDKDGNSLDKKTISAVADVNEEFPMGSLQENNQFFVAYEYISGDLSQPTIGEPICRIDVALKAFNQNWNLLDQTIVTEDLSDDDLRTHLRAPHLVFVDNKLYVVYSIEIGSPKIWVKEYEI